MSEKIYEKKKGMMMTTTLTRMTTKALAPYNTRFNPGKKKIRFMETSILLIVILKVIVIVTVTVTIT